MCNEPAMRAPCNGLEAAYSWRIAINPGISVSAIRISLRPNSAWLKSLMTYSARACIAAFIPGLLVQEFIEIQLNLEAKRINLMAPIRVLNSHYHEKH